MELGGRGCTYPSRIWVRVIFTDFCIVSQQFHPLMYFQTLNNCKVNGINWLKTKFLFCKGFSANQPRHVPITFNSVQLTKFSAPNCFLHYLISDKSSILLQFRLIDTLNCDISTSLVEVLFKLQL